MKVFLHAVEHASRTNGPGLRAVIWFQGCTLGCPSCFNPATHDAHDGYEADTASLTEEILAIRDPIEGVTISGGEPFQQPQALHDLLQRLAHSHLGRLVFSGYTPTEIQTLPCGPEILKHVDVLIAGRYVASRHVGLGLLGSSNQRIHLLTSRYRPADFATVPRSEVILHADGTMTVSGIAPYSPQNR